MPNIIHYPTILAALKEKLDTQNMSVLVGAGFSKNFDGTIFPNWWELISDMVKEGEEANIKEHFDQINIGKSPTIKEFDDHLKLKIEQYIDKIGPLQVVSDFIKRKGYREAVDIRIEEKTPIISIENDNRYISYNSGGS